MGLGGRRNSPPKGRWSGGAMRAMQAVIPRPSPSSPPLLLASLTFLAMSYVWEHVNGRPAVRRNLDDVIQRIRNEELAVTGYISARHSYLILRPWEDRHFPLFQKPVRHRQERPTTNLPPPDGRVFSVRKKDEGALVCQSHLLWGAFCGGKGGRRRFRATMERDPLSLLRRILPKGRRGP